MFTNSAFASSPELDSGKKSPYASNIIGMTNTALGEPLSSFGRRIRRSQRSYAEPDEESDSEHNTQERHPEGPQRPKSDPVGYPLRAQKRSIGQSGPSYVNEMFGSEPIPKRNKPGNQGASAGEASKDHETTNANAAQRFPPGSGTE